MQTRYLICRTRDPNTVIEEAASIASAIIRATARCPETPDLHPLGEHVYIIDGYTQKTWFFHIKGEPMAHLKFVHTTMQSMKEEGPVDPRLGNPNGSVLFL